MDMFELNKIAGAALASVLVIIGVNNLSHVLYNPVPAPPGAYPVEIPQDLPGTGTTAEPAGPSLAELLASASVEKGKKAFAACKSCHSIEEGGPAGTGPNLYGIAGQAIGAQAGFGYSKAMASKGGVWTFENLNTFLTKPKKFIAGTNMSYAGIRKDNKRAHMLAYLNSMGGTLALPAVDIAGEEASIPIQADPAQTGMTGETGTDTPANTDGQSGEPATPEIQNGAEIQTDATPTGPQEKTGESRAPTDPAP